MPSSTLGSLGALECHSSAPSEPTAQPEQPASSYVVNRGAEITPRAALAAM